MQEHAKQLEHLFSELYVRETEYEKACLDSAEKEHGFKVKQAKEYLAADGSIEARKATATVNCDKEYLAYLRSQAVRDFTKEKLRDCQQAMTARQSLLSAIVKSDFGYATNRQVT